MFENIEKIDPYHEFLFSKTHYGEKSGFEPLFMPDFLFDFQKTLTEWSINMGRSALFEDCGLGKTLQYLVWAKNVSEHTGKRVLILTPLAVSEQTVNEGKKFGIECEQSRDGKHSHNIVVTNYERIHYFDSKDFVGVVCDESSILKNFDGKRRVEITSFMKHLPYRLLCTATAAPNDYIELGTSSEALGVMGYMDMLNKFFKNDQNTSDTKRKWVNCGGGAQKWRFKKHAEEHFWRWMTSWSRAIRKPSDISFDDCDFIMPELIEVQHEIKNTRPHPGMLFPQEAVGLKEQREEMRMTLKERCEKVSEIVDTGKPCVVWCQLNDEGEYLNKIIPGSVEVAGKHKDEVKEERLQAFSSGEIKTLITKPKIAGFGLNWQHCCHTTFFPSHSYEQYYQAIRRFLRFGQKNKVRVDLVTTPGMASVLSNLQRKSMAADKMFEQLVKHMNDSLTIDINDKHTKKMEVPKWL